MHAKKYDDAAELLESGAVVMLKHGQVPIQPVKLMTITISEDEGLRNWVFVQIKHLSK